MVVPNAVLSIHIRIYYSPISIDRGALPCLLCDRSLQTSPALWRQVCRLFVGCVHTYIITLSFSPLCSTHTHTHTQVSKHSYRTSCTLSCVMCHIPAWGLCRRCSSLASRDWPLLKHSLVAPGDLWNAVPHLYAYRPVCDVWVCLCVDSVGDWMHACVRGCVYHRLCSIAESHTVSTPSAWNAAPLLSAASVADNS